MRIAILSSKSAHASVVSHVTDLAAGLARLGHDIHVFTEREVGQPLHAWVDGVHYHRCDHRSEEEPYEAIDQMNWALLRRVWAVEQFTGAFEVVHAHEWLTAPALAELGGSRRQRVMTIHFGNPLNRQARLRERLGVEAADRVIALSAGACRDISWPHAASRQHLTTLFRMTGRDGEHLARATLEIYGGDHTPPEPLATLPGDSVWRLAESGAARAAAPGLQPMERSAG